MGSFARGILKLGLALALAYGTLRATCLRLWTFPADDRLLAASVAPTLEPGDLLVLWRLGTPDVGDLVRCPDPEAQGRFVVARLLGAGGDVLVHEPKSLLRNGKRLGSERACTPPEVAVSDPETGALVTLACDFEQLGSSQHARLRSDGAERTSSPVPRVVVPTASVYLVSDNRHFHDDSRDFGQLPAASCSERVILRLWSSRGWFDAARRLTPIR